MVFAKVRTAALPLLAAAAILGGIATLAPRNAAVAAEDAWTLPVPALDVKVTGAGEQTALFAGGCFWGVQGVFQHVRGVKSAVSGYAGGDAADATYEAVTTGRTGHAETVEVTFDPSEVTYGELLRIFFSVAHDPTQLDRQGPDRGPQYRSAVFPVSDEQRRVAQAYIAQLDAAKIHGNKIVTTTTPAPAFYPAEAYHQDFLAKNPTYPYIVVHDLPKVENLKRLFPADFRADPVLVAAAAAPRS